MLKKLIITLFVLVVAAATGLSVYVSTIDWNKHKHAIAEQIEEITGKRVVFEGEVGLSFLPVPYLSAKNIKIYNKTGVNSQIPLAVIEEMVTDLRLFPLIKGHFVVDNMSLVNSKINIEFSKDGTLNWYSEITENQKDKLDNVEVELNSVMLQNATVHVVNEAFDLDISLESVNAEITAQSLFGPYRIDGNFVKDNNPAGFALNLGTLSESFATSLNLVLTHPTTESYARFDGSMLTSANEIKGNFIVESKNPSLFVNGLTNQVILPQEYNYPLASSVELTVNDEQISLSSLIIKYGDNTAGAGNVLIPLKSKNNERRKITLAFEMTDFDLMPIVGMIKEQLKQYDGTQKTYEPVLDYDVTADLKSLRANLNGEPVRNLNFSADLINNVLSIKTLSGLVPGDTDMNIKGNVFENDRALTYDLNIEAGSQDFLKFLNWFKINPPTYAASTYRNAAFKTNVSGTLNLIKIVVPVFTLDKISANGMIGIIRGDTQKYFISVKSDSVSLDNYLPQLTDEDQKLPVAEQIKLSINKLSFLNDLDLHFETVLDFGIYNKTPFEKLALKFDDEKGKIQLTNLSVEDLLSASLKFSGVVSNLGGNPEFENLKYEINSRDFAKFREKFKLPLPKRPLYEEAKNVTAKGIFTGSLDNATIKAVTGIDLLNSVFNGKVYVEDEMFHYRGTLEFRTPDFISFINKLGFEYAPPARMTNILNFKGFVDGDLNEFRAKDLNVYLGSTNVTGAASFSVLEGRPTAVLNLEANKFEFDRYFYNPDQKTNITLKRMDNSATFLAKPLFDKTKINFDFYKSFDLNGQFKIKDLSYGNTHFENAEFEVSVKNSLIELKNFHSDLNGGVFETGGTLNLESTPTVKGRFLLEAGKVQNIGGSKYALLSGLLNSEGTFESSAESEYDFISGLNAQFSLDITDPEIKGWNIGAIEKDLTERTHSDNLYDMLRDNLQQGETLFQSSGADVKIQKGIYEFENGEFISENARIFANASGQLTDWDLKAVFKTEFEKLKEKIVPFEFSLTGSLNNPNLIVDGSALKSKYDEYWEKIELEKKNAEEARLKKLNEEMASAQARVSGLKTLVSDEVLPKLETYIPLSSNADIKGKYDSNQILTNDILEKLDALEKTGQGEFTQEDISEINAKADMYQDQLNEILDQIEDNFVSDTKIHAEGAYQTISEIYENSKTKAVNYQKTLDSYAIRLKRMGSLVVLDADPNMTDYKNKIETSIRQIADLNSQAQKAREIIEKSDHLTELEQQHKQMQALLEKTQKELQELNAGIENIFSFAQKLVRQEERKRIEAEDGEFVYPAEAVMQEPSVSDLSLSEPETLSQENNGVRPISETSDSSETQSSEEKPKQILAPANVILYRSKSVPTGTITKPRPKTLVEQNLPEPEPEPEPEQHLLRPLVMPVTPSGTIGK